MNKLIFFLAITLFSTVTFGQEDKELYNHYEDEETPAKFHRSSEIGVDAIFSASTYGGIAGIGVKYGFVVAPNLIVGPSVRLQRTWTKAINNSTSYAFNVYGGGGFIHYRIMNYFFVGAELEALSSPFNYINPTGGRTWVMTALCGGGFSHSFGDFRLNAGIMYDIVNSQNSPYRYGYVIRNSQGVPQPIIYRIALFFPI